MNKISGIILKDNNKIIINGKKFNGNLNIEIENFKAGKLALYSSDVDVDIQLVKGNINITNVNGNIDIEGADNVQLDSAFSLIASSIKDEIEINGKHILESKINKELGKNALKENGWE